MFLRVSVAQWHAQPDEVLARCHRLFSGQLVAVRSDAQVEDQMHASRAGEFCTVLNVAPDGLAQAMDRVAQSMPGHPQDHLLVQQMVSAPRFVGVASSHRIADGAPWYCIELAHDDTAAVTGGRATGRQVAVARDSLAVAMPALGGAERAALALLSEVEGLVGPVPLEMEFALTASGSDALQAQLLQVRPLATARHWPAAQSVRSPVRLPSLEFLQQADALAQVAGDRTVLSLMSDWNPAELIGAHPRPLALSLFQALIADGVWWQARAGLGYAPVPQKTVGLLQVLQGRPFVDVRRSANSLLPARLPPSTRQVLVNHWLSWLDREPALHDKVEFQVFRTVRDFAPPGTLGHVAVPGLSPQAAAQWEAALGVLTARVMDMRPSAPLASLNAGIAALERDELAGQTASRLLQRCRHGTAAFAAIARIAFAAEAQLRSAVQRGALSPDRALALRAAARSSPTHAAHPAVAVGHLRPGTFDITQPTWSAEADREASAHGAAHRAQPFSLVPQEVRALEALAAEVGLPFGAGPWVHWVQLAASSREWGKFVFSRHLSAALEAIAAQAVAVGLDREQMSWLTLAQWRQGRAMAPAARALHWARCAEQAKAEHQWQAGLITGPVLRAQQDRYVADSLGALPNFVGTRVARGPLIVLNDQQPRPRAALHGAIVLVSQADPGFDWLFDHGIVGLMTQWGGANSHMAIRCAEFGLAAAIGCGSAVYARALSAASATIDPGTQSVWFE